MINASYYSEDGLILSFSNELSETIAKKLGKKCCVKITGLKKLKKAIDRKIGVKGIMKDCEYTDDHQRNHFLKSTEDQWQKEYRMFWSYNADVVVAIPKGHGKLAAVYE